MCSNRALCLPFVNDIPLRKLSDFESTSQRLEREEMVGVESARVIFANYEAIRADFAGAWETLVGVTPPSSPTAQCVIDHWLVENTAFVSTSQATSTLASMPIPRTGARRVAWRPPRYGRAAVMVDRFGADDERGAIFDVKGTGVPIYEEPVLPNSNGLLTLGEAVHEVLMEHLIYAAVAHAGVDAYPLPSYAVLDLGFDALWGDGRPPERATLLLRRATVRPRYQWERYPQPRAVARALMHVELVLRRYGLTASSCGAVRFRLTQRDGCLEAHRDERRLDLDSDRLEAIAIATGWTGQDLVIDGVNVQLAGLPETDPLHIRIMDFGRYRFQGKFENHLYSWLDADYQNLNGVFLRSDDPAYEQPVPALSFARAPASANYQLLRRRIEQYLTGEFGPGPLVDSLRAVVLETTAALNRQRGT